jgi:hypothetical protein
MVIGFATISADQTSASPHGRASLTHTGSISSPKRENSPLRSSLEIFSAVTPTYRKFNADAAGVNAMWEFFVQRRKMRAAMGELGSLRYCYVTLSTINIWEFHDVGLRIHVEVLF